MADKLHWNFSRIDQDFASVQLLNRSRVRERCDSNHDARARTVGPERAGVFKLSRIDRQRAARHIRRDQTLIDQVAGSHREHRRPDKARSGICW